ncbi:hypothetical protein RIF29_25316 [Crotalaria pallida]|uniref:Uncharacterized protein n=1 Tax=Crotalaria pallida TaxID=3830 RepID=A0AAN9HXD3_CROPI
MLQPTLLPGRTPKCQHQITRPESSPHWGPPQPHLGHSGAQPPKHPQEVLQDPNPRKHPPLQLPGQSVQAVVDLKSKFDQVRRVTLVHPFGEPRPLIKSFALTLPYRHMIVKTAQHIEKLLIQQHITSIFHIWEFLNPAQVTTLLWQLSKYALLISVRISLYLYFLIRTS